MPLLKPTRGIGLNRSHPLARGLVGCWLFNEGSGNKVFDLSGNGNVGDFFADTHFVPGKFGPALYFDGTGDYVQVNKAAVAGYPMTMVAWFNSNNDSSGQFLVQVCDKDVHNQYLGLAIQGDGVGDPVSAFVFAGSLNVIKTTSGYTSGKWHQACAVFASATDVRVYIDAGSVGTGAPSVTPVGLNRTAIGMARDSTPTSPFIGQIDHVLIYNRALSASEIALLYREPFCMFDRAWNAARLSSLVAPQIVELGGTSTALSSLSATAKVSRKVGGTIVSTSNVDGSLGIIGGQIVELIGTVAGRSNVNGSLGIIGEGLPEIQRSWLTEALFNGMTANAFKLGTSLSLGWFWVRVAGCSALYRGQSGGGMGEIDFTNILAVSGQDEYGGGEISPPSYIPHNNGSTYFYVVRRFNNCGYQERTLAAAVKVSIGSNGELAEPQPNNIYRSKIEQVDSNKILLTWFYWPCEQGPKPVSFNVYYDDRTGQIDYFDPLAIIEYKGRKFYSFQSSALEAGGYLFAIRAEDADGIENISLNRLKIQLDTLNPDAIDILRTEAV